MAMLDPYNTASNISLMRQHMGYGHIYDLNKLSQKVLLNTQYLASMNPTAGSFIVNPRLQRLFATFAINFPSLEALNTIYATFLRPPLKFPEEVQERGKRWCRRRSAAQAVARTFRKTASNFHYEFNIRHIAGVFQGMLRASPSSSRSRSRSRSSGCTSRSACTATGSSRWPTSRSTRSSRSSRPRSSSRR